LLAPNKHCHVT